MEVIGLPQVFDILLRHDAGLLPALLEFAELVERMVERLVRVDQLFQLLDDRLLDLQIGLFFGFEIGDEGVAALTVDPELLLELHFGSVHRRGEILLGAALLDETAACGLDLGAADAVEGDFQRLDIPADRTARAAPRASGRTAPPTPPCLCGRTCPRCRASPRPDGRQPPPRAFRPRSPVRRSARRAQPPRRRNPPARRPAQPLRRLRPRVPPQAGCGRASPSERPPRQGLPPRREPLPPRQAPRQVRSPRRPLRRESPRHRSGFRFGRRLGGGIRGFGDFGSHGRGRLHIFSRRADRLFGSRKCVGFSVAISVRIFGSRIYTGSL